LPDGRPVWAGTYFPKKEWINVLEYFIELKRDEPEKLQEYAQQLVKGIQQTEELVPGRETTFYRDTLQVIAQRFVANVDPRRGGRTGAPKFPMPNNYKFLMRYAFLTGGDSARQAVRVTLDHMSRGGIYDQIGGGFARYSVDDRWHVPHFEKMLYDNGQLVSLYAQAYQWWEEPLYAQIVKETLAFVARELTDEQGGFYSSLDADSEGEEGKFYVWTAAEIDALFQDAQVRAVVKDYYDIRPEGNWEEGKNVLQVLKTDQEVADAHGITVEQLGTIIASAKETLMAERDKRVRPGLDDKVLTSWNALMLKGYVDAYRAFGDAAYLETALTNARFLENNMVRKDGGLNRNYKDGKSVINAFLDDYALLAEAWIALYEVTFDEAWLDKARDLVDYTRQHFFDEATGLFFYTSDLDPPLVARKKETGDNVIPGSNSVMAKVMHKLGLYFYDTELLDLSAQMLAAMVPAIVSTDQPNFYSNWCDFYIDQVWPRYEVAIVGPQHAEKSHAMMQHFLPHAIFLGGADEGSLQLLKDKLQEGETMIYVCQNKVCKFPVTEVDDAIALMD
ncbi:MAG: thioredoxin domain-containing protein, partial [Saprospiraceae bacterium]|nr:thioredoxin domain-containing protein [Saprospiraceae bacterium]